MSFSRTVCLLVIVTVCRLTAVEAASFDCSKAETIIEKAICANSTLGQLDQQLASVYMDAKNKKGDTSLTDTQRKWLAKRSKECAVPTSDAKDANLVRCVGEQYQARLFELLSP